VNVSEREFRMRQLIGPLRELYAVILIDCPPSLGLLTVNALTASDEVIIPVQCEYLSLEGLGHLSQTIRLVQSGLNPRLRVRGIVLTMFDGRTNIAKQVEEEVRKHFDNTFKAVIPRSVRLSEAPSFGQPIQVYDRRSAGAIAYESLAQELLETLPAAEAPHA
jgi:chromosome partitioning protein